jgi:hypothetical protein
VDEAARESEAIDIIFHATGDLPVMGQSSR